MEIEKPLTRRLYRIATADGNQSKGGRHPYRYDYQNSKVRVKNGSGQEFTPRSMHNHFSYHGQRLIEDYYNDCFVIEYEVVETPIRITPVAEYVAELHEAKQAKLANKRAKLEKKRKLELYQELQRQAEKLKKELDAE